MTRAFWPAGLFAVAPMILASSSGLSAHVLARPSASSAVLASDIGPALTIQKSPKSRSAFAAGTRSTGLVATSLMRFHTPGCGASPNTSAAVSSISASWRPCRASSCCQFCKIFRPAGVCSAASAIIRSDRLTASPRLILLPACKKSRAFSGSVATSVIISAQGSYSSLATS